MADINVFSRASWTTAWRMRWSDEERRQHYDSGLWTTHGLPELLAQHASARPGSLAVVDGSEELTFHQLATAVESATQELVSQGVTEGDVVAVRLRNSVRHVVLVYAVALAGGVLLEIPGDSPEEMTASLVSRVDAQLLVIEGPSTAIEDRAVRGSVVQLDEICPVSVGGQPCASERERAPSFRQRRSDPDAVGLLISTSGTTGKPKLVMRTQNSVLAMARNVADCSTVELQDRLLVAAPLYGGVGFVNGIGTPAVTGATLVLARSFSQDDLVDLVRRFEPTAVATLPTLAIRLLEAARSGMLDAACSIRNLQTGGAYLTPQAAADVERLLGTTLTIVYGAIDVGAPSMIRHDEPDADRRRQTVGQVVPGAAIRTIGPSGEDTGIGEPGEVVMRGADLAVGYYDDAEATRDLFDEEGWGHMGDIGVMDADGYLRIVGRLKEIVIRGGRNISLNEVESHVQKLENVAQAAAVAYDDEEFGERCAVVVTLTRDGDMTLDELRTRLAAAQVPKYLWPERLRVVDRIPVSAAGKVRRRELRDLVV